jgi:hypothetical protein
MLMSRRVNLDAHPWRPSTRWVALLVIIVVGVVCSLTVLLVLDSADASWSVRCGRAPSGPAPGQARFDEDPLRDQVARYFSDLQAVNDC